MNASGCGATVKEYAHLLRNDPAYAEKAQRIVELTRDISEILPEFEEALVAVDAPPRRAYGRVSSAVHAAARPADCAARSSTLLTALGIEVRLPADSHLCCGSAGTYSLTAADACPTRCATRSSSKLQARSRR